MPKLKLPDHVKALYAKNAKAEIEKNQEIRQAIAEDNVRVATQYRKEQEAKRKKDMETYNAKRTADGKAAKAEAKLLNDEGFRYSRYMARKVTENRITVLELDKTHYSEQVKQLKAREADSGMKYSLTDELTDTLNAINIEMDELKIDLEVSTMSTEGVNHANS